jgi:hydrogenase nickel incorporation protein HypB
MDHAHLHATGVPHTHAHAPSDAGHRIVEVHQSILAANDRQAERNRGYFRALAVRTLNLVSSPGSGKTELILQTLARLQARCRMGVIVGDVATDNDARRLRNAGTPVVQITTGTLCHLDATMVARAVGRLDLKAHPLDLLLIENVGNLVCPAAFDLGEDLRITLLSVTEGEDKPLKYPPLFHSAHAVVLTKLDLAEATGFDRSTALANIRRASPHARVFEVSARTGEGMDAWCEFLAERCLQARVSP